MPGLASTGLLPMNYDMICWSDDCTSVKLQHVRLRVCKRCRVARYCCSDCQRVDWARHQAQCEQAAEWLGTAKRSIRPHDKMFTVQPFPDDALGLLASDNGVLGAPRWRFMRQSHQVACLKESGLHRLTRAQWLHHLSRPEIATIFDEVWTSVYVTEACGIAMVPAADDQELIVCRDIVRSLTARAAVKCALLLAPHGFVLALATRPPRIVRQANLERNLHEAAFCYIVLKTARQAASQDWIDIIHLALGVVDFEQ